MRGVARPILSVRIGGSQAYHPRFYDYSTQLAPDRQIGPLNADLTSGVDSPCARPSCCVFPPASPDPPGVHKVCVPDVCSVYDIGSTLALKLHNHKGAARIEVLNVGSSVPERSLCRPGHVHLPLRTATPVSDEGLVRSKLGLVSDFLFRVLEPDGSEQGAYQQTPYAVFEQRWPDHVIAATSAAYEPTEGGVALVFAGAWRFTRQVALTIRRHVVDVLGALVFAVISAEYGGEAATRRAAEGAMRAVFGRTLVDFTWAPDVSLEDLRSEFTTSGVMEMYMTMGGWAFTPLVGGVGTSMHSYRKLERGFERVLLFEEAMGRRFEWVLHSRTDLVWFADHPPLARLRRDVWWSMAGDDQHIAMPRGLAGPLFRRWKLLLEGRAPAIPETNPGRLAMLTLAAAGARHGYFPLLACLEQCRRWACYTLSSGRGRCRSRHGERLAAARGLQLRSGRARWAVEAVSLPEHASRWVRGGLLEEYELPLIAVERNASASCSASALNCEAWAEKRKACVHMQM